MRNNIGIIITIIAVTLLGALGYTAFLDFSGYRDILFASPSEFSAWNLPPDAIEELNKNKFVITYEIVSEQTLKTANSTYSAVFRATNYSYPFAARFSLSSGGFFTKADYNSNAAVAVMNEKAAFDIFGGTDIVGNSFTSGGRPYTVSGVIADDDNDNRNIYVPATVSNNPGGQKPDTLMCAIDSGASEEYIKNELKQIGVSDSRYNFINLGSAAEIIKERFTAALLITICGITLLLLSGCVSSFVSVYGEIRTLLEQFYIGELLFKKPVKILAFIGLTIIIALFTAVIILAVRRIFGMMLGWGDSTELLRSIIVNSFNSKISELQKCDNFSNIAFLVFFPISVLSVINFITVKKQQ